MRIHRLITTLLLMESRSRIKAKELAQCFETSVRTIQRDIDILCEAGIPIAAETGPCGGYYLMSGYLSHLDSFHYNEILNLFLCGIGVRLQDHQRVNSELNNALLKLEKSLPVKFKKDIRLAKQRFYFDPDPWWHEQEKIPELERIRQAVLQTKKLRIQYSDKSDKTSIRNIHPYGLVVKAMYWYLIAYCESRKNMRTFKCERIKKATLLDQEFKIPDDFSLQSYWYTQAQEFKEGKIHEWYTKQAANKAHTVNG